MSEKDLGEEFNEFNLREFLPPFLGYLVLPVKCTCELAIDSCGGVRIVT
jgi:hypothetical protein